jgi:hypothetical protein
MAGGPNIEGRRNLFMGRFGGGNLQSIVGAIQTEVGGNPELARQALADLDRQQLRDHFDGRLEYARHVVGYQETANKALIEYGLQTLKWSFLLNAGAIAVVMAYIGACAKSGPIASYAPSLERSGRLRQGAFVWCWPGSRRFSTSNRQSARCRRPRH